MERPEDICPRPDRLERQTTEPLAQAIYPTAVWICEDTHQADTVLGGKEKGYVYQRDSHPNADLFAGKCKELHHADEVAVTSCGMSALALALLSQVKPGEHVVASNMLYGRSLMLLRQEATRLGINCSVLDVNDLKALRQTITTQTKLVVVETISNPRLVVADIAALANACHERGTKLLVDNTFATPIICRPLELGADFVLESVSKAMNGHSDVMLGLLCGRTTDWERVPVVSTAWGLASSPFDCWLAYRGMMTMHLRIERASENALRAAQFLENQAAVDQVDYPGLTNHPQHALAVKQFNGRYGAMVTFRLRGGSEAAEAFIRAAKQIPFCPSLGDVSTTLSHPESTSHRGLSAEDRAALGITGGTIRLSVGCESREFVLEAIGEGLKAVRG
jgi:cystathionine beta-lyase/cystathionine gamma-synthase